MFSLVYVSVTYSPYLPFLTRRLFPQVHIDDVSELLLTVLRLSLSSSAEPLNERFNPYVHYYIAKGSSFEWRDVNAKLAGVLYERNKIKVNVPRDVPLLGAGWMGQYVFISLLYKLFSCEYIAAILRRIFMLCLHVVCLWDGGRRRTRMRGWDSRGRWRAMSIDFWRRRVD